MKKLLLPLLFFAAFPLLHAQTTYLCNEKFSSKKPSGWDIIPTYSATAPSWKPDTGICVSTKYAMHCQLPINAGDTATLVTPFFDCTNYKYIQLRFNHICKVLPSDICRIEYQEDVLGTAHKWRPIPYDAYKGGCATYRKDTGFNHSSYKIWADYDTLAKPTNGWWQSETFDMSDYAGYSKVRFRFIIRKGNNPSSYIAAGWYVDDFQVFVSQNITPKVEFITNPNDTVYSTGPFKIKAKVASRTISKIIQPYLSYSVTYNGNTQKDSIKMTAVTGDSIWEADIPQQHYESEVNYSIFAHDSFGNSAIANAKFYICYLSHDSLLKDTYTVGKGNSYDFPTLSDALYILDKYGMGGDVTLLLASGTYAERIVIYGFNITNKLHITISSLANNADSVLFRPNTGPVVSLANCAGLTFKNLTFDARKVCNNCVSLVCGLKHIEFNHCKLYGFDTAVYNIGYANIYLYGWPVHHIRFIGNEILGGSYGILFCGDSKTNCNNHILFDSNHIAGYYVYAAYMCYNKNLIVTHNRFDGARSGYDSDYGFESNYADSSLFDANRFHNKGLNNNVYGIRCYNTDSTTVISNNEIVLTNNKSISTGMYFSGTYGTKIINNSILLNGSATSYGIFFQGAYADIKNNISVCLDSGICYPNRFVDSSIAANCNLDYNCWWSSSMVGYVGKARTTLAAFQSAIPSAKHDLYKLPLFVNSDTSALLKETSGMFCPIVEEMNHDINGKIRVGRTLRGAYTNELPKMNASLDKMVNLPETINIADTMHPCVVLMNTGLDTLRGATIRVEVDEVVQSRDIVWKCQLATGETDTVPIGSFVLKNGRHHITAYLTGTDTFPVDDTVQRVIYSCDSMLKGGYTIGKGGQFANIRVFAERIMICGMAGPVTAYLLPGEYMENIILRAIPGSSATNTLTITSSTGDSSDVVWYRTCDTYTITSTALAAPLVLDNASHVIVKNITLSGENPDTCGNNPCSHAIVVTGSSHNVEIGNCRLFVQKNFTKVVANTDHSAVCLYKGNVRNVRIHHNLIEGGGTGCHVLGTSRERRTGNITIDHNIIGYVDYSALYACYTDSITFSYNRARQRTGKFKPANAYVVYLNYTNANILNNTFDFHAIHYGLYAYYFGDSTKGFYKVANNSWNCTVTEKSGYGIRVGPDSRIDYRHNSVRLTTDVTCSNCYGYYCNSSIKWVDIKNNIFHMASTGINSFPIYIGSANDLKHMSINHNCYYNEYPDKPWVGNAGRYYTSIATWKGAVSTDSNSVWIRPDYINCSENLDLLDSTGLTCPTLSGCLDDALGRPRDNNITNMGAYSFTPQKLDISLVGIVSPTKISKTQSQISVIVKNTGSDTITSMSLGYTLDGVAATPCIWKGRLAYRDTIRITLGNIRLNNNSNYLTVFCSNPNGNKDGRPHTDTLSTIIYGCDSAMDGTYSIGTAQSDFPTLQEALEAVNHCGMRNPVVLEIATGQYNCVSFEKFQAGSEQKTLTIRSAAKNRDSVIIYGIKALTLAESSHLRFEEITFEGSLVGVELNGIMEDILFRHCNIFTDSNTSSESCHAVRYPDHTGSDIYLKDVRFVSNTIWGGYDNFNLNYTANFGNCLKIAAVTIDSNIMGGAYQYAIQSNGYGHYKSISHNTITNGSHAQKFYGLYFEYEHNNDLINGNIIRLNNPSTSYGMLCYYNSYNYQFHIQGTISNNEIIINGNGTKYGIQLYAPTYNVVNNSIYVKSNATSYALHVYNYDKCPTNILNNNLINDDTIGYALYYSYSPSYTTSYGVRDYNNYYSKSGNHAYLNGTSKTTLSAITALDSTQDQHSVIIQPQWANSDSLSPSNLQVRNPKQFACPLAYDVKQDILGYLRTDNTSMGCYGFDPDPNDAHLIGFTDMGDNSSNGSHPVRIIIYNAGICPIDSAVISLTINGVLQKPFPYRPEMPLQKMQYDTVTIDTLSFQQGRLSMRAVVSMKGDTNHANDTIIYKMLVCGPNGTASVFTIGDSPSADYSIADFTRMISELSQCKVNGDIILQFEDGKYTTDSLDLTLFDSIMNGYRLTVTSKSEDRNKVTISNTSGNLFVLGGNKKLVIRNLTLEAPNGNVIHFKSSCDSIDILHNHLLSPKIGSSYSFFPICKSNSNDSIHGLRIIGNDIEGGFYGISLYGSDKAYNKGVVIDSNHIFNQYIIAINLSKNQCISISHNKLHPHTSQSAVSWCGLRLNGDIASEINGNDIDATTGCNVTSPYPFYAENLNRNVQYQAIISNNIIKCYTNFSNTYSIYANKGRADFCHNTIVMGGTGKGYAICCRPESRNYTINFWGNLIVTSKNQEILYMTYSYNNSLDYNNYYNEGERFGNCNSSIISNLAAWQKATGRDAHSTSLPVEFLDTNNCLKLKKYEMFLMPKLQKVDTDFDGVKRESLTTMGAYTHAFQPLDAALTDFAKTNFNNPSKTHIEVTLSNYGKDTLTSAIIGWSLDNVQQTPVKWSGNLPQFGSISVTLADMAQANFKKTEITAWVSNPNGKNDMYPSNDTVNLDTFICNGQMAGIYTVGGAHPDFANLDEAFLALNTCGVNAPVTLKLRSTSLNGMTITGSVPGSSNTRLITLMPDSNAKVVIDKPNGTALTIKKAAHWKFQGLTIGNDSNGMIGVTLIDSLQDIHFLNCNICANKTTSNTSSRAISMDESVTKSNYLDNVSFIGNNIKGGYYGIYIYETKNAAPNGVTIDSNNISEACCYGIYNYIGCHYKSISYNRITNRKRSRYYFNGLYAEWNSHIESIEGNRIFVQNVNGCCGIYLGNNIKTFSGKTGLLKNNEVILLSSSDYGFENSTVYGIHLYSLNHNWEIANNSILTKGDRAEVCGLNTYNSQNYKLDIKNNHFVSQGPSNYPIYLGDRYTNNYVNLDYNNYVSLSGSTIGYAGSAKSSLSSWQSATGMDTHSVSMRPIYIDSTINLQIMNNEFFICPRINTVPIDINGTSRSQITIIGCYSMKISENLQAIQFVTPQPIKDVVCYADYTPISIEVKNAGLKEADFSISPLKISLDITGAISLHSDTLITSGTIGYRQTDTISLGSIPTINGGIYNIKVTLADTSDKVPEDDTLSLIYNASRVELPYDIDFSTIPNELVNVTMFGNTGWEVVKGTGSNPTISPVFGTGRLEFAGANNPGSNANAIFNAVNIQNCINPMLSFWYAHSANCTGNDMLIVMVTTDGGANYTELKRIKVADTATAWKQYDIDLNAFTKSSCLSIVFRAMSYGGANQSIDRIRITAEKDAAISLLPINISERSVCDNTPVDVKAVITNLSRLNIDMSNDTLTLNVTGAVNYSNKIIYNHRLGSFMSDTVTLGQIRLDANGAYYFKAFMQSFDDRNSNDTVTDSTLFIWQDITLDTLFGLDGQMFKKNGDTVRVSALAVNNGNIPVEMVLLRLSIDGNEVVTDTIRKHLNAGDTVRHTMSKCYTVPAVSKDQPYYFFELKTELACDADNTNNAISIVGQVDIPDTIDIQVLEVATTAQALGKTKLAPSVRVANIGNMAVENVLLHVDVVNDSNRVVESISENISHMAINETKNHQFTMTYRVPDYTGQYTLRAYVEAFDGDSIRSNDTIARHFRCYRDSVGIRNVEQLDWSLGQNIPNPAGDGAVIPFRLPQDDEVVFCIMTANGQIVHRRTIQAVAGENRITLDISGWAAGIYYYSMEYKGQRIVRKMSVVR